MSKNITRWLPIAALLTLIAALMVLFVREHGARAPSVAEGVTPPASTAPAASVTPSPPIAAVTPETAPATHEHNHEPVAQKEGEIRPFDPKVPLESMLERRPELIRMLGKDRSFLVAQLEQARASGKTEDAHRIELRIARIDERVVELERRQAAREPAR